MTDEPKPQLSGYNALSAEHLRDPYPAWARARRVAPVFYAPELDGWVVTRREDALRVLSDTRTFSNARNLDSPPPPGEVGDRLPRGYPWSVPALASVDPPEHARLRRLVNRALSRPRLVALEPSIKATAEELVRTMLPNGRGDVLNEFARPLSERTIARVIGYPEDQLEHLRRWLSAFDVTDAEAGTHPHETIVQAAMEHADFGERCARLLAEQDGRPGDHLIAILADADERTATPAHSVGVILQVILAGVATPAHLVANMVRVLVEEPGRWAAVRDDPDRVPRTVEESLRHSPSIRGMPRRATRSVVLGGVRVRAGDRLFLAFGSANRDADFLANGEAWDPDRTDGRGHLAFGRGQHICPGARLARLEAGVALRALLPLRGLRLSPDDAPRPYPTLAVQALDMTIVEWEPGAYEPSPSSSSTCAKSSKWAATSPTAPARSGKGACPAS